MLRYDKWLWLWSMIFAHNSYAVQEQPEKNNIARYCMPKSYQVHIQRFNIKCILKKKRWRTRFKCNFYYKFPLTQKNKQKEVHRSYKSHPGFKILISLSPKQSFITIFAASHPTVRQFSSLWNGIRFQKVLSYIFLSW